MLLNDQALSQWNPQAPAEVAPFVEAVLARASACGVSLPPAPTPPQNCCGNGCAECVWKGYYTELAYWRDEALLRWAA